MILIKEISTPKYQIILSQTEDGYYYVSYHNILEFDAISEPIKDYKTAAYLFDLKLQELEGH